MFEFDQYDAVNESVAVRPCEEIRYASDIVSRSILFWSEHCIECAAPECYQTCDLFKARPDDRCRRFKSGVRRNNSFKPHAGSAAEIIFDRWGKLEARGNSVLIQSQVSKLIESTLSLLLPVSNWIGKRMQGFGGASPWASLSFELSDYAARCLHKWSNIHKPPDGFLIEIYNPGATLCNLKFECSVSGSSVTKGGLAPLPLLKRLELKPGYNRFFLNYNSLAAIVESELRYNLSLTPETVSGTHLVFICLEFVKMKQGVTLSQNDAAVPAPVSFGAAVVPIKSIPAAKCIVFDLDNTLWHGVLVEGAVTLKPGVTQLLQTLDRRGVLISVVSKNNEEEALAKLEEFGLLDFIIYPMINWSRKSDNIKTLKRKLSIGADTLMFVDDSPFEREEVTSAIPEIEVLAETELDSLLDNKRLIGGNTEESVNRRTLYKQQIERESVQIEFGDDYLSFIKQCRVVVSIFPSQEKHHERIVELLQRTNQLNFSGTKYSREDIFHMLKDDSTEKHVIHCQDKYGNYGVVGFSITETSLDHERVMVKDFMLSCRVQGKLIEKAFFNYLTWKYIKDDGELVVNFLVTDRNGLAQRVLQEVGFNMESEGMPQLRVQPGCLEVDFLETHFDLGGDTHTGLSGAADKFV